MGEGTPGPRGHRSSWTTDGCHGQVIVTMGRTWVLPHVTSAWLLRANTGLLASLCAPPPHRSLPAAYEHGRDGGGRPHSNVTTLLCHTGIVSGRDRSWDTSICDRLCVSSEVEFIKILDTRSNALSVCTCV